MAPRGVTAKMRTWATGSSCRSLAIRGAGFSLVELLVALAIGSLIVAVAVPASVRFYDSMQERQALRGTLGLLAAARERALATGRPQDVMVRPAARRIWFGSRERRVPEALAVTVHGAAELNLNDTGVIRFYPEGGSSGGGC